MQTVSLADSLIFREHPGPDRIFTCSDSGLSGKDNLVCRAAVLLEDRSSRPLKGVKITLIKNIPVEAGLAGGSSDAAAALIGLNRYWQLGLTKPELAELALMLGSDVPYCLQGGTVIARGRGESLQQLPPLPFFWVVLAIPEGLQFSTTAVYSSFDRDLIGSPSLNPLVRAIKVGNKAEILNWCASGLTNTLESAILPGTERLVDFKAKLKALGLQMALSGSGPTLFLLTDDFKFARSALRAVEGEGGLAYLCWIEPGQEEMTLNV